jgi:NADH-quinone oxidoreductase subunit C
MTDTSQAGENVRPYGGYFDEVADLLERALAGGSASYAQAIERVVIDRGEMTVFVARERICWV